MLAQSSLSGKRCLVLDDEFLIALDIQQMLERAGATEVICVASAAEALRLLWEFSRSLTSQYSTSNLAGQKAPAWASLKHSRE